MSRFDDITKSEFQSAASQMCNHNVCSLAAWLSSLPEHWTVSAAVTDIGLLEFTAVPGTTCDAEKVHALSAHRKYLESERAKGAE